MLFDYPLQETHKLYTRDLPIAAKTAWDIVPEEKVQNAAAVRGESVLSMVFTKVFVCIYADLPK